MTLDGKHTETIYLKVFKSQDHKFLGVLYKEIVNPSKNKRSISGVFTVEIDYNLSIYKKKNFLPKDNEKSEGEIISVLKRIHKLMQMHDQQELVPLLTEGLKTWYRIAYCCSDRMIKKAVENSQRFYSDTRNNYNLVNWDRVKIIFGPNLALVYIDFEDRFGKSPYLFTYNRDSKKHFLPAINFAFIDNKWLVWR